MKKGGGGSSGKGLVIHIVHEYFVEERMQGLIMGGERGRETDELVLRFLATSCLCTMRVLLSVGVRY